MSPNFCSAICPLRDRKRIDENFRRIGMRGARLQQTRELLPDEKLDPLLPSCRVEVVDGESWFLALMESLTKADRVSTLSQPVGHLTEVLGKLDVHPRRKTFDDSGPISWL